MEQDIKAKIKINFSDFWGGFDKENNFVTDVLKKHYDCIISEEPDFLFYSCFGINFKNYDNCVKIFLTGENIVPNFNECDYAAGFHYIDFGERYIRYNLLYNRCDNKPKVDENLSKRKFCNFMFSNANCGQGALLRQEFCKKLMEYKHVDCPGKVLHNVDYDIPYTLDARCDFFNKYKFTISFENSSSEGYSTEKLFDALRGNSIPIYWGNSIVTKEVNPKAFINCNDFNNDLDLVIEKIIELDNNDELCIDMLNQPPLNLNSDLKNQQERFDDFLCKIVKNGNNSFEKGPRSCFDFSDQNNEIAPSIVKKKNFNLSNLWKNNKNNKRG